jgi:hypothetical protein
MYNEMAGEEDTKTVESWKANADRILVFVSSYITSYITQNTTSTQMVVGWSVLRGSCKLGCGLNTRPSAESTG